MIKPYMIDVFLIRNISLLPWKWNAIKLTENCKYDSIKNEVVINKLFVRNVNLINSNKIII